MKAILMPLGIVIALACSFDGQEAYAQGGKDPPGVNPTHYQCYQVKTPITPIMVKTLRDQFGVAEAVKMGPALHLCAPTEKNGQKPKDDTTHYLCYQDKVKTPNRKARIFNQFTTPNGINVLVAASTFLCVPSIKKLD